MILLPVIVLAVTAALAWPLSRFDSKLTGEDTRKDMSRRGLRCAVTLVLVELALGNLNWVLGHGDRDPRTESKGAAKRLRDMAQVGRGSRPVLQEPESGREDRRTDRGKSDLYA
jgi:hypothetical protein